MKLKEVLGGIEIRLPQSNIVWQENPEISDLCYDSRMVKKGSVFFATRGFEQDGKKYIPNAIQAGAAAVIVDSLHDVNEEFHSYCIIVHDPRYELAMASRNFFHNPTKQLLLVGVTGTNGKTSCVHIIESILDAAGYKTAIMGTVQRSYSGRLEYSGLTTQESYQIQKFLHEAILAGVNAAVIEVSSHALSLHRVVGCEFDRVLFNNLDIDHQDFYEGMESYYQAKRLLFTQFNGTYSKKSIKGICNIDDPYGARLIKESTIPVISFGMQSCDYSGANLRISEDGICGFIKRRKGKPIQINSPLSTYFNCYNLTASAAVAASLDIPGEIISAGITNAKEVPGRLSRIHNSLPFKVFVDYAHNGTALHSVLKALKAMCTGRLIVVFGAGGNKDPLRRTKMGEAAAELADISVVTSDNPRFENPYDIIQAIVKAWHGYMKNRREKRLLYIEQDRETAIRMALCMAQEHDIVCIAGKGHEQGQIIGDRVIPFDDRAVAVSILNELEHSCCS